MRRVRRGLAVVAWVSSLLAWGAPPGRAGEPLGPPFAQPHAIASCSDFGGLTATCEPAVARADPQTGDLELRLGARSTDQGRGPGVAVGSGVAELVARHELEEPAAGVLYTAVLRVEGAGAEASGLQVPLSVPYDNAIEALLDASPEGCCPSGVSRRVVQVGSPPLDNQELRLAVLVVDDSGEPLPPGTITVRFALRASLLLLGMGDIHLHLVGQLAAVTVDLPTAEEVLAPPYARASANSSCSGLQGTTTVCVASASRHTGRLRMDLRVTGPAAGSAPGSGSSAGQTVTEVLHSPGPQVRGAVYTLLLRVGAADAILSGRQTSDWYVGRGGASLVRSAEPGLDPCAPCTTSPPPRRSGTVVASDDVSSLTDQVLPVVVPVWNTEGGRLPASLAVRDELSGRAFLDTRTGEARVLLDATLAAVRVVTFS